MRNIVAAALLLSFACALVPTSADARPAWKTRVNHRQVRQQKRIFGGATSGELTRREYRNIQKRQAHLASTEARYRASGSGLTPTEAAKLEKRQDNLSDAIYRQKHDNQDRN